jgi:TolB-like protein/Tfp pilus assembly protein PilF
MSAAFEIRAETREVLVDGKPTPLGARAFDVLAYLDTHRDRVVSKAELLEHVWGGLAVEEGNLTVQISTLRKLLGARAISTVPGVGYKLTSATKTPPPAKGPALPDKPSLVVLPFANLSGSGENDYLVDGLITDIIAGLSRISGLFVIAASTSFRFKGSAVDLGDVGRSLGVRYAVEGSVQQSGNRLRVTVQLVEAASGRTIWSDRFTDTTDEIFELQDRIAAQVAGAVERNLLLAEAGRAAEKPTEDLAAYDLVLRAMPHIIRVQTLEDFRKGVALLDQAIARDPDYLSAKAWRVRAYLISRGARQISMEEFREVSPLAKSLITQGSSDPMVLAFAAVAHGFGGDNQDEAAEAARKAVRLAPNSSLVMTSAGFPLSYVAAYDEAIAAFQQGLRMDPLGQMSAYCRMGIGHCLGLQGKHAEAIEILERAYAETPHFGSTIQWLLCVYWAAGRVEDAKGMAEALHSIVPDLSIGGTLSTSPFRRAEQQAFIIDAFRGVGIQD